MRRATPTSRVEKEVKGDVVSEIKPALCSLYFISSYSLKDEEDAGGGTGALKCRQG